MSAYMDFLQGSVVIYVLLAIRVVYLAEVVPIFSAALVLSALLPLIWLPCLRFRLPSPYRVPFSYNAIMYAYRVLPLPKPTASIPFNTLFAQPLIPCTAPHVIGEDGIWNWLRCLHTASNLNVSKRYGPSKIQDNPVSLCFVCHRTGDRIVLLTFGSGDLSLGGQLRPTEASATEPATVCSIKFSLAEDLLKAHLASRKIKDLDLGIELLREALALCPPGYPLRIEIINNIACALFSRYEELGDAMNLNDSISFYQDALNLRPPGHPDRFMLLDDLADALCARYKTLGNVKDLEDSISFHRNALIICPQDHPERSVLLNRLAVALRTQYDKFGNVKDLEDSISFHSDVLDLCPLGHPERTTSILNLAAALNTRYDKFGNGKDLEDSILLHNDGLIFCPPGHPSRGIALNNLANALRTRYVKFGNLKDLEDSISLHRDALVLCPPGHPDRSMSLANLAVALNIRYDKSGNVQDLEDSILLHSDVLNFFPLGHPSRAESLNNLANALKTRYDKFGNAKHLLHSISFHQDALNLLPLGHPNLSTSLLNLAAALTARYDKFGSAKDLADSILLHNDVLGLLPPNHPDRSTSLNNLAISLRTRYDKYGNAKDLEDSISLHNDVLNLCSPGHPHRSMSLNNLANALRTRYRQSGNTKDLEDSILLHSDALNLCPPGHPYRSLSFALLGISFMTRHENLQVKNVADLSHAFLCFEEAANDSISYIHHRLIGTFHWVKYARSCQHESIFRAYTTMLQLINCFLIFCPNVETQQRFLASANVVPRSLASDAASAAIAAGKIELAVEFLEQGRALLWSRAYSYKHPLYQLRQVTGGEELADRLQAVSTRLECLSLVSVSATLNQDTSIKADIADNKLKEHRVLSEEWEYLVGKVREIDGFGHFLRVAPFHTLQSAALEGPVILVNISQHRSDAIILLKDTAPRLVNLPEVLLPELRDQKCRSSREISNTLAYLWDTIVSPIVDQLKDLGLSNGSRIWWCPTGELCALPLHAAGRGKKNLQDIYISSYTSTLSSLIRARSDMQPPTIPRLLVVGQPSTDLKRVQDEVNIIEKLRPDVDVLFGQGEANREAVLENLKDHSWVHFACHGLLGDKGQPFHASFKLHEDIDCRLLLLDLIRARLPNAELAFLSACHSAAGGLSTPDESIHLSAALQFCGFKSVVGTLWEMDDEDGPMISEKFYKYMFRNSDKIDFRDSAHALNSAIKEMRAAKVPLHRLAMFVHIGA